MDPFQIQIPQTVYIEAHRRLVESYATEPN